MKVENDYVLCHSNANFVIAPRHSTSTKSGTAAVSNPTVTPDLVCDRFEDLGDQGFERRRSGLSFGVADASDRVS